MLTAKEMGVVPPSGGEAPKVEAPKGTEGEAPKGGEGEKPKDGDNTPKDGDQGTGAGADTTPKDPSDGSKDPRDERINGLMSKWQTEENAHKQTKTELELYKQQFGELPKGSAPQGRKPQVEATEGDDDLPDSMKPGWKPESLEDVQQALRDAAEFGAKKALGTINQESLSRAEAEKAVDDFVTEVKAADPEFDDKVFFQFANKYEFPVNSVADLRKIYVAYNDMNKQIREAEKRGAGNRQERKEPVNKPGAGGGDGGSKIPFSKISAGHSAVDLALDALRNKK